MSAVESELTIAGTPYQRNPSQEFELRSRKDDDT